MKRTSKIFWTIYSLMMAISVWDYFIRLPSWGDVSFLGILGTLVGSSVSSAVVASLVFLLGDAFWMICMPLTVWLLLTTGTFAFLQHYFFGRGLVGESFTVAVINLNSDKVSEFVSAHWLALVLCSVFVCLVLALAMWMVSVRIDKTSRKKPSLKQILLVIGCLVLVNVCRWDHLSRALFDQPVLHVFDGAFMYYDLSEAGRPVQGGTYRSEETNLLAVVMIGESSSRMHWSLYGYSRKTTPRLDAISSELIIFSNLTASVGFTPYALRDTFTVQTNGVRVSLPSLACAAGCDTWFVSSQEKSGRFNGADELLFNACSNRVYLPKNEFGLVYDDALVPHVLSAAEDLSSNRVVFAHMVGNHVGFRDRYPEDRAVFDPEGYFDKEVEGLPSERRIELNHYDNSILFTDYVLAEVIEGLRKTQQPVVLIFVSDHGESPRSYTRDLKDPETFAIPFFVWASPACSPQTKARLEKVRAQTGRALKSTECFPIFLEALGFVRTEVERLR